MAMKMVYGIAGITITLGYPDIRSVCVWEKLTTQMELNSCDKF